MITVSTDMLHAADHFIMREARLLDRHRFAYHFQDGPVRPVRTSLEAYRNVDGGYGNGLHPDLRGHGSQPRAVLIALSILDELGDMPGDTADHIATYLTSISRPAGGVPRVLPSARHTESAPWWREYDDYSASLNPTGPLAGILHTHHVAHPWRDRATAFAWNALKVLFRVPAVDAVAICDFLDRVNDPVRARAELDRLRPMIRSEIDFNPHSVGEAPKPLDLAPHPNHIACALFTDEELETALDGLVGAQQADGGWPASKEAWCTAATAEWRGMRTVRALCALRNFGRLDTV
ncbi:prenyltransferase [Spiractinospora alimapuensis]|uniref:prenyltransferase n=1 Tax=Spiractinospora alimapuensis TaxID=2820884 RepID=UPI001F15EC2D|nr:prenyltransferase [Spiractinospora alimapuensis]QVQ53081.1 prenyltransferase [Spiractinospora alimapuensis]